MRQYSKFSGSACRRCGAERAVWPDMNEEELHCVICGASYYVTKVQAARPEVSRFVSDASARLEEKEPVVARSRRVSVFDRRVLGFLRA